MLSLFNSNTLPDNPTFLRSSIISRFKRMLRQSPRFDSNTALLSSQTLPMLEGQDENSILMESPYDIVNIANSCPDLSLLENDDSENNSKEATDEIDGFFCRLIPQKTPLSFRKSTSLNSLDADTFSGNNVVDGNMINVLQNTAMHPQISSPRHSSEIQRDSEKSNDFIRSKHRSSYTGPGVLSNKTSPNINQFQSFPYVGPKLFILSEGANKISPSCQSSSSSKRSFFRRKQKSKRRSLPATVSLRPSDREDMSHESNSEENYFDQIGKIGLSDSFLALTEPDFECWTKFAKPHVLEAILDKDIKRQEHMYEFILTEKHHCLTLALMHHLFFSDMKKAGYGREAKQLFPGLTDLLQVHFDFYRRLKERQMNDSSKDSPLSSIGDILEEQFTGDQWMQMIRLYGLLCSTLEKSFEMIKTMKLKDQKFATLVANWSREPLLGRKNVTECLLLVGQRITKYPLLLFPLLKTSVTEEEREQMSRALRASKELNSRVNERVAERSRLGEFLAKVDSKSVLMVEGRQRVRRDELLLLPNRRLLFHGVATVSRILSGNISTHGLCSVLILTDSLLFTQDIGGRVSFVSPPGIIMLSDNIIVRENAGHPSSLYLVIGTGSKNPEMIELQIRNPVHRNEWINALRDAKIISKDEADLCSDVDEETSESTDSSDYKTIKALGELQEQDKKILNLLKSRSKLIESLKAEKPQHWTTNAFAGNDVVLTALADATAEIQKSLHAMDVNSNSVNRSASCVNQHVSSGLGLPRRADTFGGFDSQQRTNLDFSSSTSSKMLFQIVVQLAEVCGEMFQQLVPTLTPSLSQNHIHLQRRMEELREAQHRFESEKAAWQQESSVLKEERERERGELETLKTQLVSQQTDISQQREQLYRKLEKLESIGLKPYLDSVPPLSISVPSSDKTGPPSHSRRSPSLVTLPSSNSPTGGGGGSSSSSKGTSSSSSSTRQQLPLHLARSQTSSSLGGDIKNCRSVISPRPKLLSTSSSASLVQQMLPMRLSEEGGRGGRGTSLLQHSKSSGSILSHSETAPPPASLLMHGASERMSNYHRDSTEELHHQGNGARTSGEFVNLVGIGSNSIVHRRSGSSPVPMSINNIQKQPPQQRYVYTTGHSSADESDPNKILFL